LVESYANNIRRTMGGVSINGSMRVLDLGAGQNLNKGTYNTWILFGDPTLTLRNDVPANMGVSCANTLSRTQTNFVVNATNGNGALATLTFNGEILGSAEIVNGVANITFEEPSSTGTATLTVFGYNKKTFSTSVEITDGGMSPLLVIALAEPETITLGETTTLTANANGGTGNYTYSWEPAEDLATPLERTTIATPTRLGENIYIVTVDDGLNTASADVIVIVEDPAPIVCPSPQNFDGINYYDSGEFGARLMWDRAEYEYTLDRFEIYRSDGTPNYELVRRIVNTPSISHYECNDVVDNAGLYTYRIYAFYQNDCQSDYVQVAVEVIDYTSVGENLENNIAVYPNPTSGKVNVTGEMMQQVSVYNMMGQVIMIQTVDSDNVVIDMSAFDNGMYIINVMTENGNVVKVLNVIR